MRKGYNKSYVKQYDANGTCTNPIKVNLVHMDDNRKERRRIHNMPRFNGYFQDILCHEYTGKGESKRITRTYIKRIKHEFNKIPKL